MFIRMVGLFQVLDISRRDHTPRGAKARALLAMLCRTPGHRRPRRWLESRLWSDRGQEQASGSLRQALSELRKTLGPLAVHLQCDRDCVGLMGFVTDIDRDPEAARLALANGQEFLEGIDITDPAFGEWLIEERQRVAVELGHRTSLQGEGSRRQQSQPFSLRLASLPAEIETGAAQDLAAAIARITAEYLLRDADGPGRFGKTDEPLPEGLDLHVEGAWSEDRAHLKLRLVAQADQKTIWSQRLIASRVSTDEDGSDTRPALIFETSDAVLM
jgi:hypothetical protein